MKDKERKPVKKSKKYADVNKDAIMMHIYVGQNKVC